ncbi:MAG: hypothetical protein FJX74_04295, partial [Armatimonadetes bacterium]|nr:hypothetical protein [Armatimonadota bacterium]
MSNARASAPLRVAAAAEPIAVRSDWDPAGGLPPGQEAELRASALVLEAEQRLCFVSCDTMVVPADVLDAAARTISRELGIPPDRLLICATHTHHAPCTIDLLGCRREAEFCDRLQTAIVVAAT